MRSNAAQFDLIALGSLDAVLQTLATTPGEYVPIAGGTELMVAMRAGRLAPKKLISLWGIQELRFVDVTAETVTIGAGTTLTDLRRHPVIASDFELISEAASWTGSIDSQNRATLGGNLVNASTPAEFPPALLLYDADLKLICATHTRILPYGEFHLGYKRTALRPGELVHSVRLRRNLKGYTSYARRAGTRNAQAGSRVVLAGMAQVKDGTIRDVRIAAASLREIPVRLAATERALHGRSVAHDEIGRAVAMARLTLLAEATPMGDTRSAARYRSAVAANLIEEFLRGLQR